MFSEDKQKMDSEIFAKRRANIEAEESFINVKDSKFDFLQSEISEQFPPIVFELVRTFDCVLAGGAMRQFFADVQSKDIDLFFKTEEAFIDAQEFMDVRYAQTESKPHVKTYTFQDGDRSYIVQLIFMCCFDHPYELLNSFDVNANKIAFFKPYIGSEEHYKNLDDDRANIDICNLSHLDYCGGSTDCGFEFCFLSTAIHDAVNKKICMYSIDKVKFLRVCAMINKGWTIADDETARMIADFSVFAKESETDWEHYSFNGEALKFIEIDEMKERMGLINDYNH